MRYRGDATRRFGRAAPGNEVGGWVKREDPGKLRCTRAVTRCLLVVVRELASGVAVQQPRQVIILVNNFDLPSQDNPVFMRDRARICAQILERGVQEVR